MKEERLVLDMPLFDFPAMASARSIAFDAEGYLSLRLGRE